MWGLVLVLTVLADQAAALGLRGSPPRGGTVWDVLNALRLGLQVAVGGGLLHWFWRQLLSRPSSPPKPGPPRRPYWRPRLVRVPLPAAFPARFTREGERCGTCAQLVAADFSLSRRGPLRYTEFTAVRCVACGTIYHTRCWQANGDRCVRPICCAPAWPVPQPAPVEPAPEPAPLVAGPTGVAAGAAFKPTGAISSIWLPQEEEKPEAGPEDKPAG